MSEDDSVKSSVKILGGSGAAKVITAAIVCGSVVAMAFAWRGCEASDNAAHIAIVSACVKAGGSWKAPDCILPSKP